MADTILKTETVDRIALLRAQVDALEMLYARERRCDAARRMLDLIHVKRDELAMYERVAA